MTPIESADRFRSQGYLVLRDVIDPAACSQVRAFLEEELAAVRRGDFGPDEESKILSGHFPLSTRLSPRLWDLPRDEGLQATLRAVLGSDELYMHMPPTARFIDPAHAPAAVPAHQDVSYNRHLPGFVTAWVPLTEIDAACGGVAVYEGTQGAAEILDDLSRDLWLKPVAADAAARVECQPMSPGDVLLLNRWIIHESIPNRSDRTRISIDLRFFGAGPKSSKHYLDCQQWMVIAPD